MPTDPRTHALTTGRRVHHRLAHALRHRDLRAGAECEPAGAVRDCLTRAARSDTYRVLLERGCQVEDTFDAFGYYTGVIDAWYESGPNSAEVVDWKTGEANLAAHSLQRLLYALALLVHFRVVRVATINVGPYPWPHAVETFTQADVPQLRVWLGRLSHSS